MFDTLRVMTSKRQGIPASLKRRLRQHHNFTCAMCPSPIYDYEHIDGYASTGHRFEDMTLLCPRHHREKTAGRLPASLVRKYRNQPYSTRRAATGGHPTHFAGPSQFMLIGDLTFETAGENRAVGLADQGEVILGIRVENGAPLIEIDLRDEANRPLLIVRSGELRFMSASWDITVEGQRITIWSEPETKALVLDLNPPNEIRVPHADFWHAGIHVRAGTASGYGGVQLRDAGESGHASFSGGTWIGGHFDIRDSKNVRPDAFFVISNVSATFRGPGL